MHHSGKSSLVLILLRLLDPFEGTITIDGIDIVSLSRDLVRARIIGVAEEPFFFPGTVRQNMDPYGEVADDAMVQALVDMSLWRIFETRGLDTKLDKEMMSHGQRQLFNIARALLRSGNLVVFDEVTSRFVLPITKSQPTGMLTCFMFQSGQGRRSGRQPRHSDTPEVSYGHFCRA